ncbi:hypothetical protein DMUE_1556 [Dictyocoela muelleri]|nr:hypothetical protein DMUE_1556 [Dictyocoela muelleri]
MKRYKYYFFNTNKDKNAINKIHDAEITFSYKLPGSEEKLLLKMPRLYDLEFQDLESLILKLGNITSKMKWENDVILPVLEELVDDGYHYIKADKKSKRQS